MAVCRHLGVFQKWHYGTFRADHGQKHTKFGEVGEDIWNSGWDMAIFLFQKWRPSAILNFVTGQKWRYSGCRLSMSTIVPNLVAIAQFAAVIAIFRFSKWRSAEIWDFGIFQKWHHGTLRAGHGHLHTKFGEDIWNSGWDMAIFLFPKWRPSAVLDFSQPTYMTTHDGALAVLNVLLNFVLIWLIVLKILKIQFFLSLAWNRLTTPTVCGFYRVLIIWTIFFSSKPPKGTSLREDASFEV